MKGLGMAWHPFSFPDILFGERYLRRQGSKMMT